MYVCMYVCTYVCMYACTLCVNEYQKERCTPSPHRRPAPWWRDKYVRRFVMTLMPRHRASHLKNKTSWGFLPSVCVRWQSSDTEVSNLSNYASTQQAAAAVRGEEFIHLAELLRSLGVWAHDFPHHAYVSPRKVLSDILNPRFPRTQVYSCALKNQQSHLQTERF